MVKILKILKITLLGSYYTKNSIHQAPNQAHFPPWNIKKDKLFNNFLFHQNIIGFDKVMNDFLSFVCEMGISSWSSCPKLP